MRSKKMGFLFMNSKDQQILSKIYEHVASVLLYCENCESFEDFQKNSMRVEACVFNLMQVGELAKSSLSEEVKSRIPSIPWKQIYGLRNRIVHGYAGVEMKIVWDTISEDLPKLQEILKNFI